MFRIVIILCFVISLPGKSFGQSSEDSVKAVVNKLFDGMRNGDSSALREVFADSMVLQTIMQTRAGKIVIRNQQPEDFIRFVGGLKKGMADEKITFQTILVDGALASVWTPYKFHFNQKFSHCGVNSFQLVRIDGAWKIQYLIDTRRTSGCD